MARPTEYSDDVLDRFTAAMPGLIEKGCNVSHALLELGISRGTYYAWKKEHEEFAELCDILANHGTAEIEYALWQKAMGNPAYKNADTTALLAIANNKTKGAYRNQTETASNTVNIGQINLVQDKSKDELINYLNSILPGLQANGILIEHENLSGNSQES